MIDLVLPWVDGNDDAWKNEFLKHANVNDFEPIRYESWDNLQFIFRGIEKNMPWVNRVFFITWGHVPAWLNTDYPKLKIVKHEDYIPKKYLPTFNSNTIEMNYWRIKELNENFILFNDDIFPMKYIPQEYYFIDGKPCEEAVETHFILRPNKEMDLKVLYCFVNNMFIINKHFDKRTVINNNREKWFSEVYGERLSQNINLEYWNNFESFVYPHEAMPMKKSVIKEIWEAEPDFLDKASSNKIRSYNDVTQRLITIWQICKGDFVPTKYQGKNYMVDESNCQEVIDAIREQKYPIICLNECKKANFAELKRKVNPELAKLFPEKSKFEK